MYDASRSMSTLQGLCLALVASFTYRRFDSTWLLYSKLYSTTCGMPLS